MITLKSLIARSYELYPSSKRMQRTWVRQTFTLYNTNRHAFLTGGWKAGQH